MFGGLSAKERMAQLQAKSAKDNPPPAKPPGPAGLKKVGKPNGATPAAAADPSKAKSPEKDKPEIKDAGKGKEKPKEPEKKEDAKPTEKPAEAKAADADKKTSEVKSKDEAKPKEPEKPKEESKKVEEKKDKAAAEVKPKEETKPKEAEKPKEEAKKSEEKKKEAKPTTEEKPKEEPKPVEKAKDAPKPEVKEPSKPAEAKKEDSKPSEKQAAKKEDEKKKEEPSKPAPAVAEKPKEEAKPSATEKPKDEPKATEKAKEEKSAPAEKPKQEPKTTTPQEPSKPKEETPKAKEEAKPGAAAPPSKDAAKPKEEQPVPKPAAAAAAPAAQDKPAEGPKKEATSAAEKKPAEDAKKDVAKPKEEAKPAGAAPAAAAPKETPKAKEEPAKPAPESKASAAEPKKPVEPAKPVEPVKAKSVDDLYTAIFYFSGMGNLLGSALSEGVFVPERSRSAALDADEVEQKTKGAPGSHRHGEGVVATARAQAHALSNDFRQLQALLETMPKFGDTPIDGSLLPSNVDTAATKPIDRRAVDQPIHGHVYFQQPDRPSHQPPHHHHQQQQQQPHVQNGPPFQMTPTAVAVRAADEHNTVVHLASLSGSGDGKGRPPAAGAVQVLPTASPAPQANYTSAVYRPPQQSKTPTFADAIDNFEATQHLVQPPQHGRFAAGRVSPYGAAASDYDSDAARKSGGGNVDASGVKPWQLSHLRTLEAKGYRIEEPPAPAPPPPPADVTDHEIFSYSPYLVSGRTLNADRRQTFQKVSGPGGSRPGVDGYGPSPTVGVMRPGPSPRPASFRPASVGSGTYPFSPVAENSLPYCDL